MLARKSSIFATRQRGSEMMDDFSVVDDRLENALHGLRWTNSLLGGYHASVRELKLLLRQRPNHAHILDVGCGLADYSLPFLRAAARRGVDVAITAIDANARTVALARDYLRENLSEDERRRAEVLQADALNLPFEDDSFDIAHAALFLHHFEGDDMRRVVSEMLRVSRTGIIINDLHRHPLPYNFVRLLALLPFFGEMFSHDGPVSVLRGFRRAELEELARDLGVEPRITWHPGFRWVFSTLKVPR